MTRSASDTETAEFSRLFDLFERLASQGSGASDGNTSAAMDDVRTVPIPDDLAPVFRNLATLVTTRTHKGHIQQKCDGRRRRNMVAAPSFDMDSDSDVESVGKFPLGKQYPFTFKMMIHKLYELEEWAKKIKEVVENSQMQFKPLGEQEQVEEVEEEAKQRSDGHVHFNAGLAVGRGRRGSLPLTRLRSHSIMGIGKGRDTGNVISVRTQQPKFEVDRRDNVRALKKRCVGRRKSMSGPITGEAGSIGGGWIYDAAISAVEVAAPAKGPGHPRLRYQSLGGGGQQIGKARRVSCSARRPFIGQQEKPQESLHTSDDFSAKRRAMSVADSDEVRWMKMKRPLST